MPVTSNRGQGLQRTGCHMADSTPESNRGFTLVELLVVIGIIAVLVAILGIIALSGMIMRNAVILVDQIRSEMAQGLDAWSAVVEAAVCRTRPVALTAAATVLAMIPLTRSVFWGPMAIAIMGGLTIATVLTIFFVPALYAAWFKVQRAAAPNSLPALVPAT